MGTSEHFSTHNAPHHMCPVCACEHGIQNNGEEGVDCGGPCQPCSELVFERGIVNNVSDTWKTINLTNTYTNPVIVATPVTPNVNFDPVVSRIDNIDSTSFDLRIQVPGGGTSGNHKVHYFVVEEGVYNKAEDTFVMNYL